MKVNIRYTVDLEEVLDEMSNLITSHKTLDSKLKFMIFFTRWVQ